eukprot:m.230248 g.230248  ORF g.230248 m.230248 type:complete len:214 (+) comp40057_c0_seq37:1838-2479(+)
MTCLISIYCVVCSRAVMFYLFKDNRYECQDCAVLYEVTRYLIECMGRTKDGVQLKKNCIIVLCQFMGSLNAVEPFRNRFIEACLECLKNSSEEAGAVRICIYAIYNLGCSTTAEQKAHFLHCGGIRTIVDFVSRKLSSKEFDELMEVACGFLWNITDECPGNCREFVEKQGLQLFQSIYKEQPESWKSLKSILGLLVKRQCKIEAFHDTASLC